MCILIHHRPETQFSVEHLADFYSKNSDGFGAIINKGNEIEVVKTLGTLADIQQLYEEKILGREAIIHFRMQTHGDIDMTNCHPYQVTEDIWMAHNGILSTGNSADTTKSDTWHYIQDFLRPLLSKNPELIHEPAFLKVIGDHIGSSNKFGFMDAQGRVAIVNKQSGVEHLDAWLSNTYAWSPSKWGYYTQPVTRVGYNWDADGWYYGQRQSSLPYYQKGAGMAAVKKSPGMQAEEQRKKMLGQLSSEALGRILRSSYNAMQRNPVGGLVDWVITNPMKAMHLIYEFYKGQVTDEDVSVMVHADPDEAADWIEDMWDSAKEECMALAGINHEVNNDQGDLHGYAF
jgi:hypothetical protein